MGWLYCSGVSAGTLRLPAGSEYEAGRAELTLTGLARVSPEMRQLAIHILQDLPIRMYLSLSAYTPADPIPITQLQPEIVPSRAA